MNPLKNQLKKFPNVLAVYLFGSTVRGNKGKLSDVDIGVVFENPSQLLANPEKSLRTYNDLFDLFAPLARKIAKNADKMDLVFLQRTPLSLQKEVVTEGKLLYAKNINKVLDYKEKTVLRYMDIQPLRDQFYQEIYHTRL